MTQTRMAMSTQVLPLIVWAFVSCTKATPDQPAAARKASLDSVAAARDSVADSTAANQKASKALAQKTTKPAGPLRCGLKGVGTLRDTGIGDLQVGRTISAVKQSCLVIRDAVGPGVEGRTQRILTVMVGSDRLQAAIEGGLVGSITIRTPRFATADGLRVGSQLSRFVAAKRIQMAEGEQGLYLELPSHCGLAFHFSIQSRAQPGKPWPQPKLGEQHGRATVDQIIVTRCVR